LSLDLPTLIARRFVMRSDAKAIQTDVGYKPHRKQSSLGSDGELIPWSKEAVEDHLSKRVTYGHYMLNTDNNVRLFAFDIDLSERGLIPFEPAPDPAIADDDDIKCWFDTGFEVGNPREAWRDRRHVARPFIKRSFRELSHRLAAIVHADLDLDCAVAYSGHKGVHVYAFTGKISAAEARLGAEVVLEKIGGFVPKEGAASTYLHAEYSHLTVEVYPKQDTLSDGGFGNLMRLPLGRNLKAPDDPTFFVNLAGPYPTFEPVDPVWALSEGASNPFKVQGE
jgi:hypothetical protein